MATMADVARYAGVSLSTVSYVLSGKRSISAATRTRVLDAIEVTRFAPNARGQALASRRSRTIVLLFPALVHDLGTSNMEFVRGAVEAARRQGYSVIVSISDDPWEETERAARHGFADGVLVMEVALDDPRVRLLQDRGFPFALIGHQRDNTGIDFVDLDFADAIEQSIDRLAGLGHRRIALILPTTPHQPAGYGPTIRSREAFRTTIDGRGLNGRIVSCASTPAGGQEAFERLIATDPAITAVIANSPNLVPGIVQAAMTSGRTIPDDLSLIAIASPLVAEASSPPLSAIDFPTSLMGRLGAEMLIHRLEGGPGDIPTHHLLRGTLTDRATTGPAPGSVPPRQNLSVP